MRMVSETEVHAMLAREIKQAGSLRALARRWRLSAVLISVISGVGSILRWPVGKE